jgi:HAD superfamily hydrolase (TIGR01509 family)
VNDRGVFIDLDGTLADSLASLRGVYHAFLGKFGAKGTEAEFQSLNGPPLLQIVSRLSRIHNIRVEINHLSTLYSSMIRDALDTAPPMAGAQPFLERARERRWRVAVVTSSSHMAAKRWLDRNNISNKVDVVVGGDEIRNGKPAPDPYHLAIMRTKCTARRSFAIEDSPIGALSAISAGLPTWILGSPDNQSDWPSGVQFVACFADLVDTL